MRSTNEVDKEIAALQAKARRLESDRAGSLKTLEAAKQIRQSVSLQALTADDVKAAQKLKQAHNDQRECELALEDIDGALSEAARNLSELRAEREESYRAEQWQEFLKIGELAKGEGQLLTGQIMGLSQAMIEHNNTLRRLTALANESGHPTVFRLAHFRRCMMAELNRAMPHEFGKPPEPYRNRLYLEFLEQQLDSIINRAERQSEQAKTA